MVLLQAVHIFHFCGHFFIRFIYIDITTCDLVHNMETEFGYSVLIFFLIQK